MSTIEIEQSELFLLLELASRHSLNENIENNIPLIVNKYVWLLDHIYRERLKPTLYELNKMNDHERVHGE